MTPATRTRAVRIGSNLLLVALSVLFCEVVLQVLSGRVAALDRLLTPAWRFTAYLPDSVLGGIGNPRWYGHDAQGFRNPRVLTQAELVTLGDSHTYGAGLAPEEPWPFVLGAGLRESTYNMAFPGWGPGQGVLLLDRAISLKPRLIIYGFYFGNDLFDAFQVVSRVTELQRFVRRSLLDSALALETREPMGPRVNFLFSLGDTVTQSGQPSRLRRYLSDHSKVYGLLRAAKNAMREENPQRPATLAPDLDQALKEMSETQKRFTVVYRGPEWQTLLTPDYRNLVLDDRDPRIRVGLEATEAILAHMDSTCRAKRIRFLVVLLPTKEAVFAQRVDLTGRSAGLDSLVTNERRVRGELAHWFSQNRVEYLDVLPALAAAPAQPYYSNADGHPNRVGHHVIGESVEAAVVSLK